MNLAMKIKFSKEVRDALREFSKVDREAYIQNAVANQLAEDEQDPVEETAQFFHDSGSGSGYTMKPLKESSTLINPGSGYGYAGGGGCRFTSGSPVSDSGSGSVCSSGGHSSNHLPRFQQEMQQAIDQGYKVSIRNRDQIPPSEVLDRSPVSDAEQKEPEPVTSETPRPIHPVSDSGSVCSSGGNSNDHLQHSQREWSEVVVRQGNWLISHRFQQSRQNR